MGSRAVTVSRLAIPVDEPVLADTFIEVRGYFTPGSPESRAGYSGIYRRWHDGRWYPNGAVQGPVSRSWEELTCPPANVAEVLITVLAAPLPA